MMLANSPFDADGLWPCIPVRNVIEWVGNAHLDNGIRTGVFNKRGVHFVEPGGKQELAFAEDYAKYAKGIAARWPRTSSILRAIEEGYRREPKDNIEREFLEEFE